MGKQRSQALVGQGDIVVSPSPTSTSKRGLPTSARCTALLLVPGRTMKYSILPCRQRCRRMPALRQMAEQFASLP